MRVFCQVIGLTLLLVTGGLAQSITATVSGTAKDQSGAVMPGVQVTATNKDTALTRSVITNERGEYVIPLLPIGNYSVTAELPGFRTEVRENIVLQVDQRLAVNFDLQVGELTERLVVTEAASLVQSETSSVGNVIENKRIVELPLNGREFQNLTLLVPGTANSAQGSTLGFRGGISVAGARDNMTSFTLDGVDIVNGLMKMVSFKPSIDTIQEFKVQTSTYSAEYGRTAGGQVTVTTKQGTNDFHGTLFHFLRNDALDAKNLFDPAHEPTPEFKRNNVGGTIGGPIVRDRTFFFGNYEGIFLRQGITRTAAVPTTEMVNGDFSRISTPIRDPLTGQQFPGNIIPANRINRVGRNIALAYPQPNVVGVGARNFVSSPTDERDVHQFTARVDHRVSENNNLFGRYSFSNDYEIDPFDIFSGITNLPGYGRIDDQRAMSVAIVDTHVFNPSLVGELRLGYNRYKQIRTQINLEDIPAMWGIAGTTKSPNRRDYGYPAVRVTGFDSIGKNNLPSDRVDPIYQIIGNLTYTKGNHTLKLGGDASRYGSMRLNNGGGRGDFTFTGEYTGNGMADLLLGFPRRTSRSLGDTRNPLWSESFALFLQDDWKVTPRLTFNLGVRYDLQTPYRSSHDRLIRFNPDTRKVEIAGSAGTRRDIGRVDNPLSPHYNAELTRLASQIELVDLGRRHTYSFDRNDLAPRIGLAYRLLGTDRLVLRTGYGIFYNQLGGTTGQAGWNSFPFFISQTFNAAVATPNISIENPFPAALAASTISPASAEQEYRTGYVQHFNMGFQFQPWTDVLIEATYAGSTSSKLSATRNINQPLTATAVGTVASRRPFQGFGNISYLEATASANFNSLQMRFEKRYARGLTLSGAYTWSKSIDTFNDGSGDSGPPNNYDIRGTMRGVSTSDVRNRVVINYVYELPLGSGRRFLTGAKGFAGWFVSGWELSGLSTVQSGRPFTVSLTADISNTGNNGADRPIQIGNPNLPKSERSVDRWFNTAAFAIPARGTYGNVGRNTLVGPPLSNTDFSLIKNSQVGEGYRFQFRAEVFNLANHPNLDLPERQIDSRTAGQIFTAQFSRQIQFGLKFIF